MKLKHRLEAVASFVWDYGRIIDVGSNHGYLCIFFALNKRKEDIIATDCNPKSLWEAEKNFKQYQVQDQIQMMITDGLMGIDIKADDQIILAGMGTKTMIEILTPEVLKKGSHFILQSNNHLYELRKYMVSHGFKIVHEKVVVEHQKYYVIIDFARGTETYLERELRYGPCLLKQKEVPYFTFLYKKKKAQMKQMEKNSNILDLCIKEEVKELKKIRDFL